MEISVSKKINIPLFLFLWEIVIVTHDESAPAENENFLFFSYFFMRKNEGKKGGRGKKTRK